MTKVDERASVPSIDSAKRERLVRALDRDHVGIRLNRLEHQIELLDEVRAGGEEAYLADERLRAMTERWLQLAIQTCIDIGSQLVSELAVEPPSSYAGVFRSLAAAGCIDQDLGDKLAAAAGQRNVLVRMYLDIDDREVFAALGRLDDLRRFAAVVQRLVDSK
ncbi:MAG TPA: DUF86 domain-containing protein [Thermoleophilaceae bacterium]|nr:DUF86 domain-containing protein [Thermoleophilaceae bacterium]